MSRLIHCQKLKRELPGLTRPPMPGALGQELYNSISQEAWDGWLQHQTRLINEKRLSLMDKQHRSYLTEQLKAYMSGESYDQADGYIPEED
ncbi:oxidative damage protection protein [Umboniibacter marinipuniceus]|uniref:Probable Fe(2+)-trafficking protein n=1 Tax=Umboniibacter marinipuniceus TaxID=569599 RepID=A0A3M0A523_9GAMM|nr:oxidative damage protection protein [Umboniibacter marinipuniceus]RMA80271.1 Fe-S cluster biosynthesis and repair protein YggX [Umboniibacter marinipuniceus]